MDLNQALVQAIEEGNMAEVERLIQNKADVNYIYHERVEIDYDIKEVETSLVLKTIKKALAALDEYDFTKFYKILELFVNNSRYSMSATKSGPNRNGF